MKKVYSIIALVLVFACIFSLVAAAQNSTVG